MNNINTSARFASDSQLAERYAVHRGTIWRWAADGESGFPQPIKISDGCTRWNLADVEQFDAARAARSNGEARAVRSIKKELKSQPLKRLRSAPKDKATRARTRRRKAS